MDTHGGGLAVARLLLPPVDEQADSIIRLQQRDFPVIDYHVHLKGGLTPADIWFPSMSIRATRPTVIYNRW